jgi:chromosome segregation ATPase
MMSSRFARLAFLVVLSLATVSKADDCAAKCDALVTERTKDLETTIEATKAESVQCEAKATQAAKTFESIQAALEQEIKLLKDDVGRISGTAERAGELEKTVKQMASELEEQKVLFVNTKNGLTKEVEDYKKLLDQSQEQFKQVQAELTGAQAQLDELQNRKSFGVNITAIQKEIAGLWKGITGGMKSPRVEDL